MLTPFGETLIRRYREMEAKASAAIADDLAWLEAARDPDQATMPVSDRSPRT
ncbi:hypothetical protein D3C86_2200950 [compost metagenome]